MEIVFLFIVGALVGLFPALIFGVFASIIIIIFIMLIVRLSMDAHKFIKSSIGRIGRK